jgi:hypothetical protein
VHAAEAKFAEARRRVAVSKARNEIIWGPRGQKNKARTKRPAWDLDVWHSSAQRRPRLFMSNRRTPAPARLHLGNPLFEVLWLAERVEAANQLHLPPNRLEWPATGVMRS